MSHIRFVLILGCCLFGTLLAQAQPNQRALLPPEGRAKLAIEQLSQKITLAESEKDSMMVIFTDFFEARTNLRGTANMEELNQIALERDDKVKELLGEDRFVIYLKRVDEQTDRLRNAQQKIRKPGASTTPSPQDSIEHNN